MLRQTLYYLDIRKNPWKSEDALRCLQLSKLKHLVQHAYETTPFYKALYDDCQVSPQTIKSLDDLGRLPIINRKKVKSAGNDIISKKYSVTSLLKEVTSGTTGVPLTLYRSKASSDLIAAAKYRFYVMNGFHPSMKTAYWTARPKKIWKFSRLLGLHREERIMLDIPLKEQVALLQKQQFDVFYCFPSHLVTLAQNIIDNNIKGIHPKLIFINSEHTQPSVRKFIADCFGVSPIDIYGSYEFGCIAWGDWEAICQGMHINADLLFLEVVDPDTGQRVGEGERGHIVITDFTNLAMPLIRYDMGDLAVASYNQCGCGMGFPIIKELVGRSVEVVTLPSGSEIIANHYFPKLLRTFNVIEQSQVIITAQNSFIIKLKTTNNVKINELELTTKISEFSEGMLTEIQYVIANDEFINSPSGKFLDYIRETSGVSH